MWVFWTVSVLIGITGIILWAKYDCISIWEWLISTGVAVAMAGLFQCLSVLGMTHDVETWSGCINTGHFTPAWLEYYEEAIYRTEYYTDTESYTDSDGKHRTREVTRSRQVFDHWEPTQRMHGPRWEKGDTLQQRWNISEAEYREIIKNFGEEYSQAGRRTTGEHNSRMISGDPLDYYARNVNEYLYPTTTSKNWTNRVKAAPSLFSYQKVPKGTPVFAYPDNGDPFRSGRRLGSANKAVTVEDWDKMNSRLNPEMKINLIIIGFGDNDVSMALLQEAAWIGGKKNDLTICFGGDPVKPAWVRVFGWSDSNYCKHQIETICLEGINTSTIQLIETEVRNNYKIKDWKQFDYITVEPPTWAFWVYFCVVAIAQGGFWWWAYVNEWEKSGWKVCTNYYRRSYY